MSKRDAFEILPELISKEPLAPIVRQGDDQFFNVVRWTVFALIAAEELGITSANVAEKKASADLDVRRFLGVVPGNGRALGLDEAWAANVIRRWETTAKSSSATSASRARFGSSGGSTGCGPTAA